MTSRSSRPPSRGYSYDRRPSRQTASTTDESNTNHFSLPSISSLIEAAEEGTGKGAAERASIDPRLHKNVVDPQLMSDRGEKIHQHSSILHSSSPSTAFSGGDDSRAPASAINDVEGHSKRQLNYPPVPHDRPVRPLQGPVSPYATSSFGSPGTATSTTSYQGSPIEGSASHYASHQRPLPSNFPPSAEPYDESGGQYISHATPAWQHHHSFPHSNSSPYTPNQDRYVCPTCNKAFSRPSSLKIHTFSHTGEKPWRCQVRGCGKQFSVRSNMKRHEKGCHGGDGAYQGGLGIGSAEHAS